MSEKGIVFFPDSFIEATPKDYRLDDYEDVFFPAQDGTRLHGWFRARSGSRVRYFCGFMAMPGNISHRLHNLKKLHDALQIPIFIFDYREYGLSQGEISKAGTFSDAHGAFQYLIRDKGFKASSVLLFGRSLGTALAVDIASREDCLGVILEAAFTSTDDMMQRYFPFLCTRSRHRPSNMTAYPLIENIKSPLLFVHGQFDQTIPAFHGPSSV